MKLNALAVLFIFSTFTIGKTMASVHETTTTTVNKTTKKPVSKSKTTTSRPPAGVEVWTVDAQRAKCEGATTMKCLLVKEPGKKTFELFYYDIAGFDYQEGYVYTIWVRKETKTPPIPANASIYNYSLVKVVSKKATTGYSNTFNEPKKTISSMSESHVKTLIVNEEKAPCSGSAEKKCLLVKEDGKKTFELFYHDIKGFNFERGYRQTIVVNESYVPDPTGAVALPVYTLVSVTSKVPVQLESHDTSTTPAAWAEGRTQLDRKWYLRKMKDTDTSSYSIDDNAVWIEFVTAENKFSGKGPCNTYFGGFKSDLISAFQASAITNTKIYCTNIKLEEMFFTLLQNADNFTIKDNKLSFYKGDRLLLVFN
jgi:heat shock protein HslJ